MGVRLFLCTHTPLKGLMGVDFWLSFNRLMADLPSHPAPSNENLQLRMEGT
jgi:hypothetical protein